MAVESIQCPKCGSPLEVESTARFAICNYCGSRLRITRGASGHPLGVLEDIKVDTEVIAKQTAIDHLRERLQHLGEERDRLERQMRSELEAAQSASPGRGDASVAAGIMLLGFAIVVIGTRVSFAEEMSRVVVCSGPGLLLLGGGIFGLIKTQARNGEGKRLTNEAQGKARKEYRPAIARIDEQIQSTQRRIAELQADMDRLAGEL